MKIGTYVKIQRKDKNPYYGIFEGFAEGKMDFAIVGVFQFGSGGIHSGLEEYYFNLTEVSFAEVKPYLYTLADEPEYLEQFCLKEWLEG